jgi:hypothetical protein
MNTLEIETFNKKSEIKYFKSYLKCIFIRRKLTSGTLF